MSDQHDRKEQWFDGYISMLESSVVAPQREDIRYRCPCCRCATLDERGGFEICPVCFWEDDGQDDADADVVRGGPNGALSLAAARLNYARIGASDERRLRNVRLPKEDELPDT